MKLTNVFLLSLMLLTSLAITGCGAADKDNNSAASTSIAPSLLRKVEKPFSAPDREVTGLDGKKLKLSNFRGHPVIINFWATWCPPCRAELPSMNRAWAKVKGEGIIMLASNVGEPKERIEDFLQNNPIDFKVILDVDTEFAPEWQVNGMPTTYVVDSDGMVRYKAVGTREWDNEQLLNEIRALNSTTREKG